jgi:hypothetical protein
MEPNTVRFLVWLAAVAVTWISSRAIVTLLKSEAPDNSKATWLAIIICTPVVGAIAYWLLSGGSEFARGTPEDREALLKNRINRNGKEA